MSGDYSGDRVDLEVARYGLRTFKLTRATRAGTNPGPPSYLWWVSWDSVIVDERSVLGPLYVSGSMWEDGTCTAECFSTWRELMESHAKLIGVEMPPHHEVPAEDCHCGIYATHTLSALEDQYPGFACNVVAVIAAEGQTIIGDKGFRTQYARVVAYSCVEKLVPVCVRQFKGAVFYSDRDKMVEDYGLVEPPKKPGKELMKYPSLGGWSVSAQKQQTEARKALLKKLLGKYNTG